MIIKLNKKEILELFLNPISRISGECSLAVCSSNISTLINDAAGAVILYGKLKTDTGLDEDQTVTLNFSDLRKLIKIFECIQSDTFELKVDDSASVLSHKSATLSFKHHLVLDSVIKKSTVSLDKISKLTFSSDFDLTSDRVSEILKGSIFTNNIDKVYFFTKDGGVYAELTDKSAQDTDSITFNAANVYNGAELTTPLPFSLEVLRLINSNKYDKLTVKINDTYKILLFEICSPKVTLKYIIPGLTK